jgi:hypothetical protein
LADAQQVRTAANLSLVHVNESPPPGGRAVPPKPVVSFDRREFSMILGLYGRKVAQGEWRDYALDFLKDRAVFSIFARNAERPLFTIEKQPKLRNRQGQYLVTNQQGRVLKRGHELRLVLNAIEPHFAVVE